MMYHMISTVGSRLKAMEQQNGGITIKFKRVQDLHTTESVEGALEKSSYAVNERRATSPDAKFTMLTVAVPMGA